MNDTIFIVHHAMDYEFDHNVSVWTTRQQAEVDMAVRAQHDADNGWANYTFYYIEEMEVSG
jgi:hypothetical protein